MTSIGDYEFPDKCFGEACIEFSKPFEQGDVCSRCPIFNCGEFATSEYGIIRLLDPHQYDLDMAEWYYKHFQMQGLIEE